ncbi:MAG: MBL fold metallo-hydrolase, partial [Acidimicrobiia bacterium]|nr:MBL fold metallo-hydrolase [Acidimicrobiia bacterium]
TLEVLATPGHTPESVSVVVFDGDEPWGVLTGDTLFVGDVGRPDLMSSVGWDGDTLARHLYRSLRDKLMALPDSTRVFPAHGAGSACGKNMSAATSSTIGEQRETNYALRPMSENEFVAAVTEGQPVAPAYFPFAADANRHAHEILHDHDAPVVLSTDELAQARADGAAVVDGRAPEVFASGHLRGSINVPLDGRFSEFAGDVVRAGTPIVVVADTGRETEAKVRLARIGFDKVRGAVTDAEMLLAEHEEMADVAQRLTATDLAGWRHDAPGLQVVDVRNPGELEDGAVKGSTSIPLPTLLERLDELDRARPVVVYCASGVRSSIAASLLRANGFGDVADLLGGFAAWRDAAA